MALNEQNLRVGVYVDVANIARNGGYGMQYDVLREFAGRGSATPVRLNAYVAYDAERAREDLVYRDAQRSFHDVLREQGYKVIAKTVRWYNDERGFRIGKANADLNLAVDAILQSANMDRVLLATGDGDFVQVVNALQNRGLRVEVVAFDNVSSELRREADMFMSGYLIPGLLPTAGEHRNARWGEVDARARGTCYYYNSTKGFGFFRFLKNIAADLWDVDSRKPGSPYRAAFFHVSELPLNFMPDNLPSRDIIFEFDLIKSNRPSLEGDQGGLQAINIQAVRSSGDGGPPSSRYTAAPSAERLTPVSPPSANVAPRPGFDPRAPEELPGEGS